MFISRDYGSSYQDISSSFNLSDDKTQATINKFFYHPKDNCYYVFTDTKNNHIFVTRDCGEHITTHEVDFTPAHVEFDEKDHNRFIIHDRDEEKMSLHVTNNYGETFIRALDYVKAFHWHYEEVGF